MATEYQPRTGSRPGIYLASGSGLVYRTPRRSHRISHTARAKPTKQEIPRSPVANTIQFLTNWTNRLRALMTGFAASFGPDPQRSTQKFRGTPHVFGPKWTHLPTLTIGMLGVSMFWSVEMGYASPYLLSLGLSKSSMAAVFAAGPLSGLVVQPLMGALADSSTSKFGRRRPYMLLGTGICVIAMLLLGFTRGIAAVFTGWDNSANDKLTIILGVIAIYLMDFAINAAMAVDRALLVDMLRPSKQALANAWAARMAGIGSVVGFFVGAISLPKIFPFLGKTQLQVLSVIVSLLLFGGHAFTAACIKERVLLKSSEASSGKSGSSKAAWNMFLTQIHDLWINTLNLPRVIRQICMINFFASMAWFPLMFYTSVYIGDLYKRANPLAYSELDMETLRQNALARDAEATRLSSRALFYSSVITLVLTCVLPGFVATPASERSHSSSRDYRPVSTNAKDEPESIRGVSDGIESNQEGGAGVEDDTKHQHRRRPSVVQHEEDATKWEILGRTFELTVPEKMKIDLATLWAFGHLTFALCMFGTLFTDSVAGATFLITMTGIPSGMGQWAPFTLLGEAILTEPDPGASELIPLADTGIPTHDPARDGSDSDLDGDDEGLFDAEANALMGSDFARSSQPDIHNGDIGDERTGDGVDGISSPEHPQTRLSGKAGIILGINNIFMVIPQFLVTGVSAIIFAVFDPLQTRGAVHVSEPAIVNGTTAIRIANAAAGAARTIATRENALDYVSDGKSNSVVYIFRLGGVASLIAFVLAWRLASEMRRR